MRRDVNKAAGIDRRSFLRAFGGGTAALATGSMAVTAQTATPVAEPVTSEARSSPGILVFPPHGTVTASAGTEISFRYVSPAMLSTIGVTGSISGGHSGVMLPHGDGQGVSFVTDAHYEPGETVSVEADVPLRGTNTYDMSFDIAIPAPRPKAPAERETGAPDTPPRAFVTRPDLSPPEITVTTGAMGTQPGHIFVAPKVPDGQSGVMILDETGELVWYGPPSLDAAQCNNFMVQEFEGQPVLTWWEGVSPVGYGYGHFVIANMAYERLAEVQVGNGFVGADLHEFVITPRGTALFLLYHPVRWNLASTGGAINGVVMDNVVQELELGTGRVLFEWHALDHIEVEETYSSPPMQVGHPLDYVHLNSMDASDDDTLLISARNSHAIYLLDRASGDIIWRLNGKRSDFSMDRGTPFAYQHDARWQADGTMTLFDNATEDPDASERGIASRGLVLDLDVDTMRAEMVREYIHETGIVSVSQGNTQVLANGNIFIGWGSAPVFTEFGPDGDMRFNGRFPIGTMSYRAFRFLWRGRPVTPPDIAVENASVFASWNGATDVASWRVLGGSTPDALQRVSDADRTGFETQITGTFGQTWFVVQALDAQGRLLGISEPMRNPDGQG